MDISLPLVLVASFTMGVQASGGDIAPVPSHLTAACKVQTAKTVGSNISYDTYEHCLKK